MEGIEIYEKSKKELDQLKKHLTNSGLITINFDNLLILCIIYFLYKEHIDDQVLLISLILLLPY